MRVAFGLPAFDAMTAGSGSIASRKKQKKRDAEAAEAKLEETMAREPEPGTVAPALPAFAPPRRAEAQVPGCPNLGNPYHVCSEYCRERYGAAN